MRNNFFRLIAVFCLTIAVGQAQAQMQGIDFKQLAAIKDINGIQTFIAPMAAEILKKDMNLGPRSRLQLVKEEVSEQPDADYVEVVLRNENVHTIRLTLKGPRGFYKDDRKASKILFVASGFFAGRSTVKVMEAVDNAVIVGYEYPHTPEEIQKRPELAFEAIRLTSAQMAAAMQWLSEQRFVNRYEIYSVGVSLGGIFLPSAVRIAQGLGVPVAGAVFAYTGSDFGRLAVDSLKDRLSLDALRVVKGLAEVATLVHNPEIHLPYLSGRFLVIHGDSDTVFPEASRLKYENAVPDAKEVVVLKGGHINLDKTDLIQQTQSAIKKWLEM